MSHNPEISPDFWTWAARDLVRCYGVDGQDYIAIVDWYQMQRVDKRAKRRFPSISEMDQGPTHFAPAADTLANLSNPPPTPRAEDIANHSNLPPTTRAKGIANHSNPPSTCGEEDWRSVGTKRAPPSAATAAVLP